MSLIKYARRDLKDEWPELYTLARRNISKISDEIDDLKYYPPTNEVFNAFVYTPLNTVRVVIIGQDPYSKKGQAMGLSFSVPDNVSIPPSLYNIFRELKAVYKDFKIPKSGDLTPWAEQGVLLLNMALTVAPGKPGSHLKLWKHFLDLVIDVILDEKPNTIFVLWGKKAEDIMIGHDEPKYVLIAGHPSPSNRNGGFVGVARQHFKKINKILKKLDEEPIDWLL